MHWGVVVKSIKMSRDVVAKFSPLFKHHLIFACIGVVLHFIDLSLDHGKTQPAFELGQCIRDVTPSGEFSIAESGEQHLYFILSRRLWLSLCWSTLAAQSENGECSSQLLSQIIGNIPVSDKEIRVSL
jgi:hypothetical protein